MTNFRAARALTGFFRRPVLPMPSEKSAAIKQLFYHPSKIRFAGTRIRIGVLPL
jgi:hypothetical protein